MWNVVGIMATASLFAFFEIPPLLKAKQMKEIWLFFILLLLGTGVCIAVSFDLAVPNPLDLIYWVFNPMSQLLDNLLKVQ